jgi:hypothetical protein
MTFSASSFFAGVGTVFAAVVIGFAGGATLTTSSKVDPPNRLERVAAGAAAPAAPLPTAEPKPAVPPAPAAAAAPLPAAPAVEARNDAAQTPSSPDRVVSLAPTSQPAETPKPAVASQPPPAAANDDTASKSDTQKAREAEARKEAAAKRAERRAEWRRKRQDPESAANAVRQMRRDDSSQEVFQREVIQRDDNPRFQRDDSPRFGFFGDDN